MEQEEKIEFVKGDKFQVISKYGPPYIQGEVESVYSNIYIVEILHGLPLNSPVIKSTNGVCYSLDQIKKIQ